MFNIEVRDFIKGKRVYGYEVAAALGMSETAFSRMLNRKELGQDEKSKVFDAIERATKGGETIEQTRN